MAKRSASTRGRSRRHASRPADARSLSAAGPRSAPHGGAGPSRGKRSTNVAPPPSRLSAVIAPPCASANSRAMARPRPEPCSLVVKNGVKIAARAAGGGAGPPSRRAAGGRGPPRGPGAGEGAGEKPAPPRLGGHGGGTPGRLLPAGGGPPGGLGRGVGPRGRFLPPAGAPPLREALQ